MLKIEKNVLLDRYTTLKIGAPAEFFAIVRSRQDLEEAIIWAREQKKEIFVLGGGSNLLISKKVKALVIKNEIKGISIKGNLISALSGESWTKMVSEAVKNGLRGAENLYLIPGTVGAAPVQNIGAYGVELRDVFHSLLAIDLHTGQEKLFNLTDCQFAYRSSVFKTKLKGRYFIYSLTLKLCRRAKLKLDYGSIREELAVRGISKPQPKELIKVIESIRNSKLPNPVVLPNAGSFFQNPVISLADYRKLARLYPDIKSFPTAGKGVKVPAGWLIEKAGFRGKAFGPVRMYEKQALILVNSGGASARQALSLVAKIQEAVKKQFKIDLKPEVNII